MIKTFDTYQEKTNETAVYPPKDGKMYIVTGLYSEVGEFIGKVSKEIRGDKNPKFKSLALKELGDILWFTAQLGIVYRFKLSKALGLNNIESFERRVSKVPEAEIHRYIATVASIAAEIYAAEVTGAMNPTFIQRATNMLITMLSVVAKCYNSSIEQIANENISKLKSRKKRGKIKGSGDER